MTVLTNSVGPLFLSYTVRQLHWSSLCPTWHLRSRSLRASFAAPVLVHVGQRARLGSDTTHRAHPPPAGLSGMYDGRRRPLRSRTTGSSHSFNGTSVQPRNPTPSSKFSLLSRLARRLRLAPGRAPLTLTHGRVLPRATLAERHVLRLRELHSSAVHSAAAAERHAHVHPVLGLGSSRRGAGSSEAGCESRGPAMRPRTSTGRCCTRRRGTDIARDTAGRRDRTWTRRRRWLDRTAEETGGEQLSR